MAQSIVNLNQPLLSICIPTYNRADTLDKCLKSIVENKLFSDNVEIVVSDNNSDDNTSKLVREYCKRYSNIAYYRNHENLGGDRNILLSLQRGSGIYLKLLNDYCIINENGLQTLLSAINRYKDSRAVLFFNNIKKVEIPKIVEIGSFDNFVETAGWSMSWISNHGFWKTDFQSWKDADKYLSTKFLQVDWLIRSFRKYNKGIIIYSNLLTRLDTKSKQGDYNFFKVHTTNFFCLFEKCRVDNFLSEKSLNNLKRKVLRDLLPWIYKLYIRRDSRYTYTFNDGIRHLYSIYHHYYWAYLEIVRFIIISPIRKLKHIF